MNHRLLLISIALILFSVLLSTQAESGQSEQLEISNKPSKNTYLTGELVDLNLRLDNKSTRDVTIKNGFSVLDGYLKVYISSNGIDFEEYFNTKWGTKDGASKPITLKPNEAIETSATLLWNYKPALYSSKPLKDKIATDYAFPNPGNYLVKSKFVVYLSDSKEPITIESDPVSISITEPVGEDLEVWMKIKDRGDIAFFLQEGAVRSGNKDEQDKLVNDVQQILSLHPGSMYSQRLRENLESFTKKK